MRGFVSRRRYDRLAEDATRLQEALIRVQGDLAYARSVIDTADDTIRSVSDEIQRNIRGA